MAETAMTWLSTNGLDFARNLVVALAIFFIGRWIANKVGDVARGAMRKSNMDDTLVSFLGTLVSTGLLIFVILAALGALGVETTSFAALIAGAGLAIGAALNGTLANLASGVMLLIFRPYHVEDLVDVAGGIVGTVEELGIFNTVVNSLENKRVIVPNSHVTAGPITNLSTNDVLRVDTVIPVGYDQDLAKAKAIMEDVINNYPNALQEPAASVNVMEFGDSAVKFAVRPYSTTANYWDCFFGVQEEIKLRFDEAGILMAGPAREIHMTNA